MRILALLLIVLAGAILLVPPLRGMIPNLRLSYAVWQWAAFSSIGMAALLYFLAPKN